MSPTLTLTVLPGRFSVCKLAVGSEIPVHLLNEPLSSITRTDDEISLVAAEEKAEPGWQVENGWRVLKVAGPLDFSLVGILYRIAEPLAQAGISIFVNSTYDTDYVMVKDCSLGEVVTVLRSAGMVIDGVD